MGRFTAINQAQVSAGGVYFLPGSYVTEILRVFVMKNWKGDEFFIAECKILDSDNSERPVGSKASMVVNMDNVSAMGNIKAFLAAASGIDPKNSVRVNAEITEEIAEIAVAEGNPFAGTVLELDARIVKTREGGDFTKHFWSPSTQPDRQASVSP